MILDPTRILANVALAIGALATIGAMVFAIRLLSGPWWPSVTFQISQRPGLYTRPVWGSLSLAVLAGCVLADTAGLYAALILWTLCAPRYLAWRGNAKAWNQDGDSEIRRRALAVRNRERARLDLPELDGSMPWPQYIIDAARADRQIAFQHQFEVERSR